MSKSASELFSSAELLPSEPCVPDQLKAQSLDEANDRFSLIRAQEGGAILRRYNASIAAVRAGLEKVPARYRETTTAAVQAYMKVAHDLWNQMTECENSFGRARRLQMDAQMRFAQSSKSFMAHSENARKGLLKSIFARKPSQPGASAEARDLTIESANALRAAVDSQTDALMKHNFLQGEFERTLNEMAQIVQQHMVNANSRESKDGEPRSSIPISAALAPSALSGTDNKSAKARRNGDVSPVH